MAGWMNTVRRERIFVAEQASTRRGEGDGGTGGTGGTSGFRAVCRTENAEARKKAGLFQKLPDQNGFKTKNPSVLEVGRALFCVYQGQEGAMGTLAVLKFVGFG